MEIVVARPPMWEEIDAAFHVAGKPVIFTWGTTIYNPENCPISAALRAHEAVHAGRQVRIIEGPGYIYCVDPEEQIKAWWRRYIADHAFRYTEELYAHRAEYRAIKSWTKDRNELENGLRVAAQRLASPLYGGVTSYPAARRAIVAERMSA